MVAGRVLDLRPDRVDPALNAIRGASAIDEGRSVLVDRDALGGTQHLQRDVLQLNAQFLGDHFALRQDSDVFDHRLARSEEHTSELQSLMRISYAVFCLKKKKKQTTKHTTIHYTQY